MKKIQFNLRQTSARLSIAIAMLSLILSSCGDDRGGVIVDASGEVGGGTQPGGGGFAFVVLFLVVASSAIGMFAMDRIKKSKPRQDSDDQK